MVVECRPLLAAAALSGLAMAMGPYAASAHGIESSLERVAGLSGALVLESQFSTGEPAAGASVSLVAPGGQTLAVGQTDAQGQLRFRLPASVDGSWELRVDRGPGHRDYLELPLAGERSQRSVSRSVSRSGWRLPSGHDPLPWAGGGLLLLGVLALGLRRVQGRA